MVVMSVFEGLIWALIEILKSFVALKVMLHATVAVVPAAIESVTETESWA